MEQESLNNIFNERQQREMELKETESEIEKHLSQTQQLLQNMSGILFYNKNRIQFYF